MCVDGEPSRNEERNVPRKERRLLTEGSEEVFSIDKSMLDAYLNIV